MGLVKWRATCKGLSSPECTNIQDVLDWIDNVGTFDVKETRWIWMKKFKSRQWYRVGGYIPKSILRKEKVLVAGVGI